MQRSACAALVWWGALSVCGGCSTLASDSDTYCAWTSCSSGSEGEAAGSGDSGSGDSAATTSKDNPWWCEVNGSAVTSVPAPPTPSPKPTKVRYRLPIIDYSSAVNGSPTPVQNPTISACPIADPDCSTSPITPYAVTPPSAAAPLYQIDLPYGFFGAIRITASGYLATEYFFGGPLVGDSSGTVDPDGVPAVVGLYITPITEDAVAALVRGGNITRDPTAGVLAPRLLDCNGQRAAGVTLNLLNPTGRGFTLLSNVPVFSDPILATDARAVSGYANITPGNYQVDAISPDGVHYGRTGAVIIENTMTILEIRTDNQGVLGR